jgi:hypothetical protein
VTESKKQRIAREERAAYYRSMYKELGPLSEGEMVRLRILASDQQRRRYLWSIYGKFPGQVAWMEYLKWLRKKEREEAK